MKVLNGAIVGYGFIASEGHAPAYMTRAYADVNIVAIADGSDKRRGAAQARFPDARIYADAAALIAAGRGHLDFVDIATPPVFHAPIASMALEAGLHVLCEKPLTTSAEDARALVRKAAHCRRVLFPCHNYRHAPVVKTIQAVIDSGKIGTVTAVMLSTFRNTHAKGTADWRSDWRREHPYSGGGIAMDHGSHTFYLCFDWLGQYPSAISARMACADRRFDTEDNFSAFLAFPAGSAHVHLSWTAGVRKVIYTVQGSAGAITVDDDNIQIAVQQRSERDHGSRGDVEWSVEKLAVSSDWMDSSHVQWFNAMFDDFRAAIDHNEFVGRDTRNAVRCVEVIQAAYRSAQERSLEVPI